MDRYIEAIINSIKSLFKRNRSFFSIIVGCKLHSTTTVYYGVKLVNSTIAKYTYIAPGANVVCADIGAFCSIAKGVDIGLATHPVDFISTSPLFYSRSNATKFSWSDDNYTNEFKGVHIGNDVWIGLDAKIMGGLTIGDGAIVAAGAIVTKNVPPYAIVAGVPAQIVRYRFPQEIINQLLLIKWWKFEDVKLKGTIKSFQTHVVDSLKFEIV